MEKIAKKKILIAEDEKPMAKALKLKLDDIGYEVKIVGDGEQAIKELQSVKYDLLLLDLMMPKKDGFAVLEEIKNKNIGVPAIVSSNLSQEEDFEKAKLLGAKDYFVKSDTSIAEVVQHIKKVLTE